MSKINIIEESGNKIIDIHKSDNIDKTSNTPLSNTELSNLKSQGLALNNDVNQKVEYVDLPYNTFTWDENLKRFGRDYAPPAGKTIVGFLGYFTNGGAVLGVQYTSASQVFVMGWIPRLASSVAGDYIFKLSVLLI